MGAHLGVVRADTVHVENGATLYYGIIVERLFGGFEIPFRSVFWVLHVLECLNAAAILAVGGAAAHGLTDPLEMNLQGVPGKLIFILLLATATVMTLLFVMITDYMGYLPTMHKIVRKNEWAHLGACVFGMLLWIGASAAAWYTCDDLCPLEAQQPEGCWPGYCTPHTLKYATLCCKCSLPAGEQFGPYCTNPSYTLLSRSPSATYEERTYKYETTQALVIIETILILISALTAAGYVKAQHKIAAERDQSSRDSSRSGSRAANSDTRVNNSEPTEQDTSVGLSTPMQERSNYVAYPGPTYNPRAYI